MSDVKTAPVEIEYPSSDGKPELDGDFHNNPKFYAWQLLEIHFRGRDDVYVSGNLLIYYEEGNVEARVAPDVFVVLGVSSHDRDNYLLWREGKAPDFVLEVTSNITREEDQGHKRELYRQWGVKEYFQYDPTGDYLEPVLQGQKLTNGEYVPMAGQTAVGLPGLTSEVLGLELHVTEDGFRFRDPATRQYLPSNREARELNNAREAWAATKEKFLAVTKAWDAAKSGERAAAKAWAAAETGALAATEAWMAAAEQVRTAKDTRAAAAKQALAAKETSAAAAEQMLAAKVMSAAAAEQALAAKETSAAAMSARAAARARVKELEARVLFRDAGTRLRF